MFAGLKTGLVEKFDFSAGTSSRSTKLIHGGVRYLQKAVFNLDIEQVEIVPSHKWIFLYPTQRVAEGIMFLTRPSVSQ